MYQCFVFWPFFSVNVFYKTLEGPNFDSHWTQYSNDNSILKRHPSDSTFIGKNVGSKGYRDFSVTKGHRTGGPWLKLEAKNKCSRLWSSQICHNDIHKNIFKCESSSLTSGQHSGSYIQPKDERYSQQGPFRFIRGNLGLSDKKWDHDYC